MSSTTTTKLPAIAERAGGALVVVLNDVENYLPEGFELSGIQQVAIGRLVRQFPELNTENSVGTLVNLFAFHGVSASTELRQVLREYGLETVSMAVELSYELGMRTTGSAEHVHGGSVNSSVGRRVGFYTYDVAYDSNRVSWFGRYGIDSICELIICLREVGAEFDSVEGLAELVYRLGGLRSALMVDMQVIYGVLSGEADEDILDAFRVEEQRW